MQITQDLRAVWLYHAQRGDIRTRFDKDNLEIGIRLDNGEPRYYSKKLDSDTFISGIEERFIEGTDFVIQYNLPRASRPGAPPSKRKLGKQIPPDPRIEKCRFACHNIKDPLSLLVRDNSAHLILPNKRWNAYYNLFPFEEYGHFIWVPSEKNGIIETLPHLPQKLDLKIIEDILALHNQTKDSIIAYNTLHAGATVDHIHVHHVFYKKYIEINGQKIPLKNNSSAIENAHNSISKGILENYPINTFILSKDSASGDIWKYINNLQEKKISFNWILLENAMYITPRKAEHELVEEFPGVLAFMEIFGKIITTDRTVYDEEDSLLKKRIYTAFSKIAYTKEEMIEFIK